MLTRTFNKKIKILCAGLTLQLSNLQTPPLSYPTQTQLQIYNFHYLTGTSGILESNIDASLFTVFPNPAKDNITITANLKEASDVSFDIIDLIGRKIDAIIAEEPKGIITKQYKIANLPNGSYLVHMKSAGKLYTRRLIIAH